MNSDRLKEIFDEALSDVGSSNLNGKGYEARMRLGIKITRDLESGEIIIYDLSLKPLCKNEQWTPLVRLKRHGNHREECVRQLDQCCAGTKKMWIWISK